MCLFRPTDSLEEVILFGWRRGRSKGSNRLESVSNSSHRKVFVGRHSSNSQLLYRKQVSEDDLHLQSSRLRLEERDSRNSEALVPLHSPDKSKRHCEKKTGRRMVRRRMKRRQRDEKHRSRRNSLLLTALAESSTPVLRSAWKEINDPSSELKGLIRFNFSFHLRNRERFTMSC